MSSKTLVWILGTLLILVLLAGGHYFWRASQTGKMNTGALESAQTDEMNQKSMTAEEPTGVMVKSIRNPSFSDLNTEFKKDGAEDEGSLDAEETGELDQTAASAEVMNELGESYDETKY